MSVVLSGTRSTRELARAAQRQVTEGARPAVEHVATAYDMAHAVVVDETLKPFANAPPSNPVGVASHYFGAVMNLVGMADKIGEVGIAAATAPLAKYMPALAPVRLGAAALGMLHTHAHPPSLVPPAPPVPLPSFGAVMLPGAISVLVSGVPPARAGDVGLSITCGTLSPPFEIALGSSNVFFGGGRAARVGTDLILHDNPAPLEVLDAAMTVVGHANAMLSAGAQLAEGKPGAAAVTAAQQAADLAALALKHARRLDPGGPPDFGTIIVGAPDVKVGGLPVPAFSLGGALMKCARGLAKAVTKKLRAKRSGASADGTGTTRPTRSTCGTKDCP